MKRPVGAVLVIAVLACIALWLARSPRTPPPDAAPTSDLEPSPRVKPTAAISTRPPLPPARLAERNAVRSNPQLAQASVPRPEDESRAPFAKLASLEQSFTVAELLSKNAQDAEAYVGRLCDETRKLRELPVLSDKPSRARDAAEFMAPLIDYEKPLDNPPGLLHFGTETRERLARFGADWSKIPDTELAGLDFAWLTTLARFDHWTLLGAGRLREFPGETNLFWDPIPNYSSLQIWSKLRYALALRRGDVLAASAEVRHLADLIRSQGILIAEMIAVQLYLLDGRAHEAATRSGYDVSEWSTLDADQLDRYRRMTYASIYFTWPGVSVKTLKKAVGCIPSPCSALLEGIGVNRALGASAMTDNLELVSELATTHGCEPAMVERLHHAKELSLGEVLASWPFADAEKLPKLLGR